MSVTETMEIGVVVERRRLDNPWQDHAWRTVAVLPGGAVCEPWLVLDRGEGWERYLAGTLTVELHPRATSSYRDNLMGAVPQLYVVLRRAEGAAMPYAPYLATVAPDEAQTHLESGDDLVDALPMPAPVMAWIEAYMARHHVEQPFYRRERKPHDPRKGTPRPPPAAGRRR